MNYFLVVETVHKLIVADDVTDALNKAAVGNAIKTVVVAVKVVERHTKYDPAVKSVEPVYQSMANHFEK